MTNDIFGEALLEYTHHQKASTLFLHTSYGDTEIMPIEVFFRDENDFSELEYIALSLCDGKVLDVGAGAGAHSLYLQQKQFDVYALEISPKACECLRIKNVHNVIQGDFYQLQDNQKYDTLLFLMNGIGITGTLDNFKYTLRHCETLLNSGGQLLFDSSDISYLYRDYDIPTPEYYYGEITYQYEYNNQKGTPFPWLYIDQQALIKVANEENWVVQILFEDENDQYLVRMEKRQGTK